MKINDFEFHVMAYLYLHCKHGGYSWGAKRWLQQDRQINLRDSSVNRILKRLEKLRLASSFLGEPEDKYAGTRRRYYRLTELGTTKLLQILPHIESVAARLTQSLASLKAASIDRRLDRQA